MVDNSSPTINSVRSRLTRLITDLKGLSTETGSTKFETACAFLEAALPFLNSEKLESQTVAHPRRNITAKPGPKPRTKRHAGIASIARPYGKVWGHSANLSIICTKLDEANIPTPKNWETPSWKDMMRSRPAVVRSYVGYSISSQAT